MRAPENTEGHSTPSHSSLLSTHSSESEDSEYEDPTDYDEINKIIDAAKEESDRILREQGIDPDSPPYNTDYSVFDEAADNSYRWFLEWKDSLDPEEYQAIVKKEAEKFSAEIDRRVERRKQIKKERKQREKEAAEREAQQAKARAEAKAKAEAEAKEEEELGPPPSREEHERWSPTPSIPTSFRLVNCGHPKCKLHDGPVYYPEDDKNSPYYWNGSPSMTSRIFHRRL